SKWPTKRLLLHLAIVELVERRVEPVAAPDGQAEAAVRHLQPLLSKLEEHGLHRLSAGRSGALHALGGVVTVSLFREVFRHSNSSFQCDKSKCTFLGFVPTVKEANPQSQKGILAMETDPYQNLGDGLS